MRINGKEIENNQRMTYTETIYVNDRVAALVRKLEKDGYDVSHERSSHSEANYITINDETVSFRNHDYFSGVPIPEHTVWLSHFDTWTDAKNHFFDEILPIINGEKIEKKEVEKEIKPNYEKLIEEAVRKLEKTTDANMKMLLQGRIKHLKEMA